MLHYVQLLRRNPDFARLWVASVISLAGDWFDVIALTALVSKYTNGSGLAVSGLLLAHFLPPLIISPYAGVLADRFNRKNLLIYSDLLRVVIVLLLIITTFTSALLWLVYVLVVLQFMLSAVFEPARGALMPNLVSKEDLLTANTLSNITWSAMLAVGGMLGGVTASLFGTGIALVIDAFSFAFSAYLISRIKTQVDKADEQKTTAPKEKKDKDAGGFIDGVRYVAGNPGVLSALFIKFGLSLGSVDTLMIAYATALFVIGENGAGSLGILYSAFGLGAVIGPLLLNKFNNGSIFTMRRLVIAGFGLVTLGWFLFGLAPTLLLTALALTVRAMGGSATWTYSSTLIQLSVPDQFLGRVFSLDWAGYYLAITISTLVTGLVIDSLGKSNAQQITLGTAVVSLVPLLVWIATVIWLERIQPKTVPAGD